MEFFIAMTIEAKVLKINARTTFNQVITIDPAEFVNNEYSESKLFQTAWTHTARMMQNNLTEIGHDVSLEWLQQHSSVLFYHASREQKVAF